jgi:hypothetical protein
MELISEHVERPAIASAGVVSCGSPVGGPRAEAEPRTPHGAVLTPAGQVTPGWFTSPGGALAVHFTAKRDGAEMSMDGVDVLRIDGDKIAEVWLFSTDQQGEDAFWDAS